MNVIRRKTSMVLLVVLMLAGMVSALMAGGWLQGNEVQAAPNVSGQAQLDLIVTLPRQSTTDEDGTVTSKSASIAPVLAALNEAGAFTVDSFFDIDFVRTSETDERGKSGMRVSNIGSSGEDGRYEGPRLSSSNVDSFFDISWELFGDPDFDVLRISAIVTLGDPSNPGLALDGVELALKGRGNTHYGHVTVLK
jgi:hypothetical protein